MNRMQWDSRFFLTGAGVMAVLFLLDGDWLLLPVCLLALMWGARPTASGWHGWWRAKAMKMH